MIHIKRDCSKLAQKEYKTTHNWEGKMNYRKLYRNLNLIILPNGIRTSQNVARTMRRATFSEIQTDQRERETDRQRQGEREKNLPNNGLCRPGRPQSENQRKWKKRQVLRPYQRTKNAMEYESGGDTNCNWCTRNDPQGLDMGAGKDGNKMTSREHPIYNITKID